MHFVGDSVLFLYVILCVCVCARVFVYVRACVRARARARSTTERQNVHFCVRSSVALHERVVTVCACVCVSERGGGGVVRACVCASDYECVRLLCKTSVCKLRRVVPRCSVWISAPPA